MSQPRESVVNTSVGNPAGGRRATPHSSLRGLLGMLFRRASYWMCQPCVIRWLGAFSVFIFRVFEEGRNEIEWVPFTLWC